MGDGSRLDCPRAVFIEALVVATLAIKVGISATGSGRQLSTGSCQLGALECRMARPEAAVQPLPCFSR